MIVVLILVSIGLLFGRISETSSRLSDWLLDSCLILCCGVLYACFATDWFSMFYLKDSYVMQILSDIVMEYLPVGREMGVSTNALLPMLVPRYFYENNRIFDALAWGQLFSNRNGWLFLPLGKTCSF